MTHRDSAQAGNRFEFGSNWRAFLSTIDEEQISAATKALTEALGVGSLEGRTFLDIGSGSGLSSLAARRLGAIVHSFDFDLQSVACTRELKRRYFPEDKEWHVEQGSVLDGAYLRRLGHFDVVYSWGVLHHTGAMWLAIEYASQRVARDGGKFVIAIYNDQGWKSHLWWFVKLIYNRLPRSLRRIFVVGVMAVTYVLLIVKYTVRLKPLTAFRIVFRNEYRRGMSAKYDRIDWVGGFPYEFARFEVLKEFVEARGFTLIDARRNSGLGCSELTFKRSPCAD